MFVAAGIAASCPAQCVLEGFTDEKAIDSTLFGSGVDIQGVHLEAQ